MKKALLILLIISIASLSAFTFVGCKETKTEEFGILNENDPIVKIEFSTGDVVNVELYKDTAPISVENFLKYVDEGFYEGTMFHRIIKDFMVQTGGFVKGEDGYLHEKKATHPAIYGEFSANGCTYNNVDHLKGVISMARSSENSATTQFFFCTVDNYPTLNGNYAAFGRVIDEQSMNVIYKFDTIPTTTTIAFYGDHAMLNTDTPTQIITIKKITVIKR